MVYSCYNQYEYTWVPFIEKKSIGYDTEKLELGLRLRERGIFVPDLRHILERGHRLGIQGATEVGPP